MSIRKAFRTALQVTRVVIIVLMLVSMFVGGATAARRAFVESQDKPEKTVKVASPTADLTPSPTTDEPSGNMAKGSHPVTEQVGVFQAVTVLPHNDDLSRRLLTGTSSEPVVLPVDPNQIHSHVECASLAQAAPLTARVYTLVGAIPSGTM
jgi:hypothetical protein